MKKYGILLVDTGADIFNSGEHHDLRDDNDLIRMSNLKLGDFEVVYTGDITPYPHE